MQIEVVKYLIGCHDKVWGPLKETIYEQLESQKFQKEKNERKLFKEVIPENLNLGVNLWSQQLSQNVNPKQSFPRHIIMKQFKIKDRMLKAAREKKYPNIYSYQKISQQTPCRPEESWMVYAKCWKKKTPKLPTMNILPRKVIFQKWRKDKDFTKQIKAEGVCPH